MLPFYICLSLLIGATRGHPLLQQRSTDCQSLSITTITNTDGYEPKSLSSLAYVNDEYPTGASPLSLQRREALPIKPSGPQYPNLQPPPPTLAPGTDRADVPWDVIRSKQAVRVVKPAQGSEPEDVPEPPLEEDILRNSKFGEELTSLIPQPHGRHAAPKATVGKIAGQALSRLFRWRIPPS